MAAIGGHLDAVLALIEAGAAVDMECGDAANVRRPCPCFPLDPERDSSLVLQGSD